MDIPYDDIFAVVRAGGDPQKSFDALREVGRAWMPSEVWDKVRTPKADADIWLAAAWLAEPLKENRPTGVYFGLDTLNEQDGNGSNLEGGWTRKADPTVLAMDWAYALEGRCDRHLVDGIYKAHRAYRRFGLSYPSSLPADYVFFFGYSGVVLAAALERLGIDWPCLFIWGFHDGGLCYLARSAAGGVTRLAAEPDGA